MNKSIWQMSWHTRCVVYCMPIICHNCIIQYDISFRASLKKLQSCTTSLAKHLKYIAPFIVQQCFCFNPSFASLLINVYWYAGCGHVYWSEEIWDGQGLLFTYIFWVGVYFNSSCCYTPYRNLWGVKVLAKQLVIWWRNKQNGVKQARIPNQHGMYSAVWCVYWSVCLNPMYVACAINHVSR